MDLVYSDFNQTTLHSFNPFEDIKRANYTLTQSHLKSRNKQTVSKISTQNFRNQRLVETLNSNIKVTNEEQD